MKDHSLAYVSADLPRWSGNPLRLIIGAWSSPHQRVYLCPTTARANSRGLHSSIGGCVERSHDSWTSRWTPTMKRQPARALFPRFINSYAIYPEPWDSSLKDSRSRIATRTRTSRMDAWSILLCARSGSNPPSGWFRNTYLPTYLPTLRYKGRRYWRPRQGGRAAGDLQGPRGRLASSMQLAFLLSNARHESLGGDSRFRNYRACSSPRLLWFSSCTTRAATTSENHVFVLAVSESPKCHLQPEVINCRTDLRRTVFGPLYPLSGNLNKNAIGLRMKWMKYTSAGHWSTFVYWPEFIDIINKFTSKSVWLKEKRWNSSIPRSLWRSPMKP